MHIISIYDTEQHSKNGGAIDIQFLFTNIQNGFYKKEVEAIRLAKSNFLLEDERVGDIKREEKRKDEKWLKSYEKLKELKGKIKRVTVSGLFSDEGREAKSIKKHSGLIDIDIDGLEKEELIDLKAKLIRDRYCYACFVTCGGDGLAFICRIDATRHEDAWEGLSEYFFSNYGIRIDKVHKSVANTRNVSYDPDIFVSSSTPSVFKDYIKKKKDKPQAKFVYSKSDFDDIIKDIVQRRIDFCSDYVSYRNIGFAIANKFGISGEFYFHAVCQFSERYSEKRTSRDYKYFCKDPLGGITISTFYARCKEFNIETYSKQTQLIGSIASTARLSGKTKEDTIKNLIVHENIPREICEDIVNQVFDDKIEVRIDEGIIPEIKNWLKHEYDLKLNEITQHLENKGKQLEDRDFNSIVIAAKTLFGEKANTRLMIEILNSDFVPSYNPIHEFFENNKDKCPVLLPGDVAPIIKKLWQTIETDKPEFLMKFGTKWLVGLISAAHYVRCPLMLIFQGGQGVGKTEFAERLLPTELSRYFGNPSLDKDNDFKIALGSKLLIIDDEVAGKSKKEDHQMKTLLSAPSFTLRKPYGHTPVDVKRLAVLFGTSNVDALLTDQTGNRRFIPVKILGRDFKAFDEIDKTELLMAAYQMWKDGYNWTVSGDDINDLQENTKEFESNGMEYELITKYFIHGTEPMTSTDIKVWLENKTGAKISLNKIGSEMNRLKFDRKTVRRGEGTPKAYLVKILTDDESKQNYF